MTAVAAVQFLPFDASLATNCDAVTVPFRRVAGIKRDRSLAQSSEHSRDRLTFGELLGDFLAYKQLLGRTEMRTRERKDRQSIRTV